MTNVIKKEDAPADASVFSFEELERVRPVYRETDCPFCRANRKRDRAIDELSGRIVDVLATANVSPMVAFEVLGLAGSFYAMERITR